MTTIDRGDTITHRDLTPAELHPVGWIVDVDPAGASVVPGQSWIDTSAGDGGWVHKVRNSGDTDWERVRANGVPASIATLTLVTGAASVNSSNRALFYIAAEAGLTDELDTLSGGFAGQIIFITADAGDTITVKHNTGNIELNGAADYVLTATTQLMLLYDGTDWKDLGVLPGAALGIDFNDSIKVRWGTDNDLEAYHDGVDGYLTNNTGNLYIGGVAASAVIINNAAADVDFTIKDASGFTIFDVDATAQSVGIGGATVDRFRITGIADQAQLVVLGNATQSTAVVDVRTSAGGGLFAVSPTSVLINYDSADIDTIISTSGLANALFIDGGNNAFIFGGATAAGFVLIDGHSDEVQLTVQANATQTANVFVAENSGGTDLFAVGPAGKVYVSNDIELDSIITILADQTSDTAPIDDTTRKKLTLQRLAAAPTNAAYWKATNSPGTPTNDFYLVLEEG